MSEKKGIAILGATGSIGKKALEIIAAYPSYFDLQVITANKNADLLIQLALLHKPNTVVIVDENQYKKVSEALWNEDIHVYAGKDALCQVVESGEIHTVLTAIVGFSGLEPTIAAIRAKKQIALANKESLVAAGELVTRLAKENGVNIYPVASEHSAIFQCLSGEFKNRIEKIYLTIAGGPFRGFSGPQLKNVTRQAALASSKSVLDPKLAIDSATFMNKGFEAIEAKWLFNLKPKQIEVVVHQQSIVHGIVQFEDGSMKAQMGLSDMRLPIQFSLTYPDRFQTDFPRFNFMDHPEFSFEKADLEVFKNLNLAFSVIEKGGTAACVLNAANDVFVHAFLNEKISFVDIAHFNEAVVNAHSVILKPGYEDYVNTDLWARDYASNLIQ
ncbi:MAG: 1-deoxy-D-xylulose-5-phosphate reductoisomerase [Crocinitomicaceae bacterium]